MASVKDVVSRARTILNDEQLTRWSNDELLGWLNEAYAVLVQAAPSACSVNQSLSLVAGAKQSLPQGGLRLLDVIRNLHSQSNLRGISVISRSDLNAARPNWYAEEQELSIENFVFDELDPTHFYVYPPAQEGAEVEAIFLKQPSLHEGDYETVKDDLLVVNHSLAPAITDYILFRAFSKDADHVANANRAALHANAFSTAVGTGFQLDLSTSPNSGNS
ncbi:MAG: DUF6682 family protein [Pontibacterium sp.]